MTSKSIFTTCKSKTFTNEALDFFPKNEYEFMKHMTNEIEPESVNFI